MKKYNNKNKLKFSIVSSIIPNSDLNLDVLNCLETVRRFFNVDKIELIQTSANSKIERGTFDVLPSNVVFAERQFINENLKIEGDLNHNRINYINASTRNKGYSLIYGLPSFQSEPIARQIKSQPTEKHIWCSGTVSEPWYKDLTSAREAEEFHELGLGGLLIEEQPNGSFRVHKLQYRNGSICLLKWKFSFKKEKHIVEEQKIKAVIYGDTHPDEADLVLNEENIRFTKELKIKKAFFHDWFNGTTISHHNEGNIMLKNAIFRETGILRDEVKLCADFLLDFHNRSGIEEAYFVDSNHPDHLFQYLDDNFRHDFVNYDYAVELNHKRNEIKDVSKFWKSVFNSYIKVPKKWFFLKDSDLVKIGRFITSEHSHRGVNGARGSLKTLDKFITLICGHSHSPKEGRGGSIQVGTSTKLILGYTSPSGLSSWAHALSYVNENDTANLLIAIDKNYTLII